MTSLSLFEVPPAKPANACVIWLHGLGASNRDFVSALPHIPLPSSLAIHYVFPQAPDMPVTINNGYVMPAWYDILEVAIDRKIDEKHIVASAAQIEKIIAAQVLKGIPANRIVVAGFSQGGAVAIQAALTSQYSLGGLIVLSSYVAIPATLDKAPHPERLPVLIQHGKQDPVVPYALGEKASTLLRHRGFKVELQAFNMEHSLSLESLQAMGKWLGETLK